MINDVIWPLPIHSLLNKFLFSVLQKYLTIIGVITSVVLLKSNIFDTNCADGFAKRLFKHTIIIKQRTIYRIKQKTNITCITWKTKRTIRHSNDVGKKRG